MHSAPDLPLIQWHSLQAGQLLGKGGFADVYLGNWNGVQVAIKQLRVASLPGGVAEDFRAEAKIHAKLNFPHIVRLFGITEEVGHFAMVLEYLPKGSLYDVLQDTKVQLPWPLRWEIALDVGKGLAYLHNAQILHRDLKSLNVLLDKEYHAKISDFGQSKVKLHTATSSVSEAKNKGTSRWRSPESFMRGYKPTEAGDIYSYGMALWEIASRALPYAEEQNENIVISWIKGGEQEKIPSDTPALYAEVIKQAWSPELGDRPPVGAIVEHLTKAKPSATPLVAKPWHFDPEKRGAPDSKGYELFPAGGKDVEKVLKRYQNHPVPGYDIKAIEVIHNPDLNRMFAGRINTLQHRHVSPAFVPKWAAEGTAREQAQRAKIDALYRSLAQDKDPDAPNVNLNLLWHGTIPAVLDSVFKIGFANLATTDFGFFGKGLYWAFEAEYSYRVYATQNYTRPGVLLLSWIASYSAYPVIYEDMKNLKGKGNHQNYDAHFIPVSPRDPNNPKEVNYDPTAPGQKRTYTELVVFESASCLPRYLVHLQPALPKPAPTPEPALLPGEAEFNKAQKLLLHARYQEALPYFE